ncbi:hypothetical protein MHYP_G00219070 [Metynnis hypsauchen]
MGDHCEGLLWTLTVQLSDQKKKKPLVIKSSDILTPLNEPILLLKLPKSVTDIESAVLPTDGCMKPNEGDELQVSGYSFIKTEGEMALGRLTELLKDHPWRNYVIVNLVLVALEKLVEQDFVCPCRPGYSEGFFFLYLVMPLLLTLNFSIYLWISKPWSDSEVPEQLKCCKVWCKHCGKILTCAFPPFFWLALFFGDGRFVACVKTPLKEDHVDTIALPPWEWCDRNRTLTDEQNDVQITFYISKIAVFTVISAILLTALICLICQCCNTSCNRCYNKTCCRRYIRFCSRCCGCCCCGWCEEYLASTMEALHSSVRTVHCVEMRTEEEKVTIYSVCDGTEIFMITLEKQDFNLRKGETYIIEYAEVEEDHPVPKMILKKKKTRVFRTAPLQLDDNLFHKAKESINPSSERAALNDTGLYLKKGYITLTGEVVSQIQRDEPVTDVKIKEGGVTVTVSFEKKAPTVSLKTGQKIEISHVKVEENKLFGKKLMSSYYTVVTESQGSRIKVVGRDVQDDKVLMIEDWQELSVPSSVWRGEAEKLLQTLPAELKITRWDHEVTNVEKAYSEKFSMCRVHCVAKRTVERGHKYDISGDSVTVSESKNVALCSVSDGATVYLITLKGDQISKLQEGETYNIKNPTVKKDRPVSEMILGNEAEVSRTTPLQLDEELIRKAKEIINPSSEETDLKDVSQKKGYITVSGEVVSVSAPQWIQVDIIVPLRDVEIQEAGVSVTLSLYKDAATVPLETGQMIKITHVKVDEERRTQEKKLMSSDYTIISVQQGSTNKDRRSLLKHERFTTSDDCNFLSARRDQDLEDVTEKLMPAEVELDMILTPAFVPELSFDNMPGVSRTVAGALTSTGKRSRTSPATGDTSEYMSTMINVSSQVPQGDITRSRPSTFLVSRDWR